MFAKRLKELRLNSNMKQSDLANKIDVSPSTIGMYEQGRRSADQETLIKLAEIFNVSVDYLLGRTDKMNDKSIEKVNKNTSDEKNVEKIIDELLQQDDLMLCGQIADEDDLIALRNSLRLTIDILQKKNEKNKKKH